MKRRGTLLIRIGELKTLLRRTFVFILFISAFLLILLSRVDSVVVDAANRVVMNVTGPVMQIVDRTAERFIQKQSDVNGHHGHMQSIYQQVGGCNDECGADYLGEQHPFGIPASSNTVSNDDICRL